MNRGKNEPQQNQTSQGTQKSCFHFAYVSSHAAYNHSEIKCKCGFPVPHVCAGGLAQHV